MSSNGHPTSRGDGSNVAAGQSGTLSIPLARQLAIAQQITHIGSWEWDIATNTVRWSDELFPIYGLEPQAIEVTFEGVMSRIHPDDREHVRSAVRFAIEGNGRFSHRERIIRPDGSLREIDSIGEVVYDAAGKRIGLIGTCRDITDEVARNESIRLYAHIVQSIQIGFSVWRIGGDDGRTPTLVAFNPAIERAAGVSLAGATGKPISLAFPALSNTELPELLTRVASQGTTLELARCPLSLEGGVTRTFWAKAFPLPDGSVGLSLEDITNQVRARQLQAAEQRVLEMVVSGTDLETVLGTLIRAIEEDAPPTLGSIQLLDAEGSRIRHGAAPHLPAIYNRAIDGLPIGPRAGSCGTAAYLRRPVFVGDIETDPLWEPYRDLALSHGLRACWSTPIFSSEGRVLGTFALYHREPREPGPEDLELISRATHVAAVAIERKRLDDQLRALSARIEAVREDERTTMAREIHDELGQALTALKMDVAWLRRRAPPDAATVDDAAQGRLESMSQMIDGIIDQVRRISAELRPGVLDDLGLSAAVEWQAQEFSRRFDISCSVRSNAADARFDRNIATAIFRILQEALTNVVRHARATHADVSLSLQDGILRLDVQDDGTGIAGDAASRPTSLGLLGMHERARRLGGSVRVSGKPGAGTLVVAEVPLPGGGAS